MENLEEIIGLITPQSETWRAKAKARLDSLCMPHWALGRLMDLAMDLAGIQRTITPSTVPKVVVVMAADHGVASEGVSKYPQEVTAQMMLNFIRGGAGINTLARQCGADVMVVDMGVAHPLGENAGSKILLKAIAKGTRNMVQTAAMDRKQAFESLEAGISIAEDIHDRYALVGTGDMGIANTTASAAVISALTGYSPEEIVGRGTGLDDTQYKNKISVVERALALNQPNAKDPIDVLARVGGFEIGGLAGLILGAAAHRIPVVIDGFISTAAALIAHAICPISAEYMIAAHRSMELGHRIALSHLGKEPLLDLSLRLGEGTGSAVAMMLVDSARHILTEVSTFDEAAVSTAER
jgi:nicotinate-nucleotide--dimethylbenzimidazole phosphoribosyltransferase